MSPALPVKEQPDELAEKVIDVVLEERCASEAGTHRYRPLLEERARRIVARLIVEPNEDGGTDTDALIGSLP
jgi:hypothetical protein